MTITSHRTAGSATGTATAPASPVSATAGQHRTGRPRRHRRSGAFAVEVSSLVGRVRSATSSPSGLHLIAGLAVTALGAAAAALLLAPA